MKSSNIMWRRVLVLAFAVVGALALILPSRGYAAQTKITIDSGDGQGARTYYGEVDRDDWYWDGNKTLFISSNSGIRKIKCEGDLIVTVLGDCSVSGLIECTGDMLIRGAGSLSVANIWAYGNLTINDIEVNSYSFSTANYTNNIRANYIRANGATISGRYLWTMRNDTSATGISLYHSSLTEMGIFAAMQGTITDDSTASIKKVRDQGTSAAIEFIASEISDPAGARVYPFAVAGNDTNGDGSYNVYYGNAIMDAAQTSHFHADLSMDYSRAYEIDSSLSEALDSIFSLTNNISDSWRTRVSPTNKTSVVTKPFTDLNLYAWYMQDDAGRGSFEDGGETYLEYVISRGLMTGTSATKFDPEGKLTRAQAITVLYRYATGSTATDAYATENTTGLTDVAVNTWYTAAVNWGVENGIVTGYRNIDGRYTRFGPNDYVTREQLAAMLFRYAMGGDDGVEAADIDTTSLEDFRDQGNISGYARSALAWCVNNGIMIGSNGGLLPKSNATRTQAAKMYAVCSYNAFFMAAAEDDTDVDYGPVA